MTRDVITRRFARAVSLVAVASIVACGRSAPIDVAPGAHQFAQSPVSPVGSRVSGTFAPMGPPLAPPVRVDAGGHCIIA
jgi:hypothetical protein